MGAGPSGPVLPPGLVGLWDGDGQGDSFGSIATVVDSQGNFPLAGGSQHPHLIETSDLLGLRAVRYANYKANHMGALGALAETGFTWGAYLEWSSWTNYRDIVKFHDADVSSTYIRLYQNTNNRLGIQVRRGGTTRGGNTANNTAVLGVPTVLTMAWDPANLVMVIRVNGADVFSATLADPGSNSGFDRYEQTGHTLDCGRCGVSDQFLTGDGLLEFEAFLSAYGN